MYTFTMTFHTILMCIVKVKGRGRGGWREGGKIQAGSSMSGSLLMKNGCVLSSFGTRGDKRLPWLPPRL